MNATTSERAWQVEITACRGLAKDSTHEAFVAEVAKHFAAHRFGVKHHQIASKRRTEPLASARKLAVYVTFQLTDVTQTRIGQLFGMRQENVCHTRTSIANLASIDKRTAADLAYVLEQTKAAIS